MSDHDHQFDANKVFLGLFIFTALEVLWGYTLNGTPKWFFWGGLMFFALLKGLLILQYFMHFKFEGWIVKGLIAPTPFLVMVIIFALMPDIGANSRMDHEITDMLDPQTGEVVTIGSQDGDAHDDVGGH